MRTQVAKHLEHYFVVQVSNVQGRTPVTDAAVPSLAGPPLFNVLPRRSYLLTFRCNLQM